MDSEVLLRLAERRLTDDGLDIAAYLGDLAHCRGRLAATLVDTRRPEQVLLVRGNMPLELRLHRRRKLLAYASEPAILVRGLTDAGWGVVPLAEGEGLVCRTTDITRPARMACSFGGLSPRTALSGFGSDAAESFPSETILSDGQR